MGKRKFKSGDVVVFTNMKETKILTLIEEFPEMHGWTVEEDNKYVYMSAYFRRVTKLDKALK